MSNEEEQTETSSAPSTKRTRSVAWEQFENFTDKDGDPKVKCKKCGQMYMSKDGGGTSNMVRHMKTCGISIEDVSSYPPLDQGQYREKIASAIIKHGLPFSYVELEGIRDLHHFLNPHAKTISRNTAKADVLKVYKREKENLKRYLRSIPGKICLTSDLWSSITTDQYMVVTAHFITKEWELQKKVIAFFRFPPPHTSANVSERLINLLKEWGIEKKIFTITLDNASYNKNMVNLLKKNYSFGNGLVSGGQYFHVRCGAHILNLIVQEGLKVISDALFKIRESVKYVRGSDARKSTFSFCLDQIFDSKMSKKVRQDVPTRWNSTYLMLENAIGFREAYTHLNVIEPNFESCPSEEEWEDLEKIKNFIKPFYDITTLFSGTSYPTANLYFYSVWKIQVSLRDACTYDDRDDLICCMAKEMKGKFEKYWDSYSLILSFAVILDPRYKLRLVEFCYTKLYGQDGFWKANEVYEKLNSLLLEYIQIQSSQVETQSSNSQPMRGSPGIPYANDLDEFGEFQHATYGSSNNESDLKAYMDEKMRDYREELDILDYWKSIEFKYKALSFMARDILNIPITTVASESAFSIGGRILDKYRSCLLPENVEALLCTNDWLHGTPAPMNFDDEELVEDFSTYSTSRN